MTDREAVSEGMLRSQSRPSPAEDTRALACLLLALSIRTKHFLGDAYLFGSMACPENRPSVPGPGGSSFTIALFLHTITAIVMWCSHKQMGIVDTWRVVAAMQSKDTERLCRNMGEQHRTMRQFESNPCRSHGTPIHGKLAITIVGAGAVPGPTTAATSTAMSTDLDLPPKPLR